MQVSKTADSLLKPTGESYGTYMRDEVVGLVSEKLGKGVFRSSEEDGGRNHAGWH